MDVSVFVNEGSRLVVVAENAMDIFHGDPVNHNKLCAALVADQDRGLPFQIITHASRRR